MERVLLITAGTLGLAVFRWALTFDRSVAPKPTQRRGTGFIDWMIANVAYSDAGGGALPAGLFFMTCLGSVTVGLLGY